MLLQPCSTCVAVSLCSFLTKHNLVERIGVEPIQSYCCAGDLQSLEFTDTQPFLNTLFQVYIIKQTICYALDARQWYSN